MKPKELARISPSHSSFSVELHKMPFFLNVWHYHKEIELLHIRKSTGTKFIGDHIGNFYKNDIILLGSNLPHMIVNDKTYFEEKLNAEALVFHFDTESIGKVFFSIPEMKKIYLLLERAKVGLIIKGNKQEIISRMNRLYEQEGFDKLISFLELLHIIAVTENSHPLSTTRFLDSFDKGSNSKLNQAYEFIFKNFNTEISLDLIADHVHMNASAFSRFFKKATNKSFIYYLNELRVGYACKKLLEDQELTVSQICYESGFNNLSNFNKQFKTITGKSPKEYVRCHLDFTQMI